MKTPILISLLLFLAVGSYGQYSAIVTEGKSFSDLDIKISRNVLSEDLAVEIGYDILSEDFTIAFTTFKSKADVIIADSYSADFEVNITSGFADIDIEVSDDILSEDIAIEIKKSGYADYLVYNENCIIR